MTKFLMVALFLFATMAEAQLITQSVSEKRLATPDRVADSLIMEFRNSVYDRIYNPAFWAKDNVPAFTILKIEVDKAGKVTDIRFSDSADTLFLSTYSKMKKYHNDRATSEKYAKAKRYKDISILIQVYYEPGYISGGYTIHYRKLESLMQFQKQDFTGRAIVLSPIEIKVLAEHDM